MQFDRHNWNLALLLVRQAEGDGAGHRWMSQNGLLQFANVNRVAARLDHILHAPHQPDQAKAVARGQVARAQPTVAREQALAVFLVLPIVGSKTAAADLALARHAGSNAPAALVNHADAKRR